MLHLLTSGAIRIFNAPGDVHEREAERVSERVVDGPAQRPTSIARGAAWSSPSPAIRQVLASAGQPLDRDTGKLMEARLGFDFSDVRLHTDSRSAQSATAIGARAYTVGTDIVFASGELAPATAEGRRLLAHELTHVVQQRQGGISLQRQSNKSSVGAILMGVDELRQAGVKVAPESQSISTPARFDRQVEVLDDDRSQTHRVQESQVRNSPEYVDNGLASVGAELENIFTLDVTSLVFRYQDGRELKIPPGAIYAGPTETTDRFVRRKGVIFPIYPDGSIAYNEANTPTIFRGALIKKEQQRQGRADDLQAARLVFTFQMNIASLAGAASGLPEGNFETAASGLAPRAAGVQSAVAATSSTARAAEDVDRVLMELRDEATSLTQRTSASGTPFTATKFGSVNDAVFKSLVKQAVQDGRLPPTIRTSPSSMNVPGSPGIDVWDTVTGRGWDLMTARSEQVLGHEGRYVGRAAPDGTLINEVIPLVYSR